MAHAGNFIVPAAGLHVADRKSRRHGEAEVHLDGSLKQSSRVNLYPHFARNSLLPGPQVGSRHHPATWARGQIGSARGVYMGRNFARPPAESDEAAARLTSTATRLAGALDADIAVRAEVDTHRMSSRSIPGYTGHVSRKAPRPEVMACSWGKMVDSNDHKMVHPSGRSDAPSAAERAERDFMTAQCSKIEGGKLPVSRISPELYAKSHEVPPAPDRGGLVDTYRKWEGVNGGTVMLSGRTAYGGITGWTGCVPGKFT